MSSESGIWWLLFLAIAATYLWRGLGVVVSTRVQAGSALFEWVNCVSYAMLAGLVARMTLMPLGSLATIPTGDRIGAMAFAFVVFFSTRRSVLAGVLTGVITLMVLAAIRQSA